ncbi:MAG: hypothetical protein NZ929_04145 [Aigarchaeota archaeon]|nr:hypothetical protein [Aigarchaeota archaeon]MCX8193400.1 hypothetical protein [Nitrososphaeria archaeon]MDW7985930.1 hypothetical protein [Nitrososphaerota archaeon]
MGYKSKGEKEYTICCPEIVIELLIDDSGECASEYGGMVIRVLKPDKFPWENVFKTLLKLNHEIYVDEREGILTIISKPKID